MSFITKTLPFSILIAMISQRSLAKPTKCNTNIIAKTLMITLPLDLKKAPSQKKFYEWLSDHPVGGILILKQDIRHLKSKAEIKKFLDSIKAAHGGDLLFAVDQEGGPFQALTPRQGFSKIPTMANFVKNNTPQKAFTLGQKIAKELKEVGIRWNLAPVVDVNYNLNNPVISKLGRSFGTNPKQVSSYANQLIKGIQSGGVIATAKHFPGYGSTKQDSHKKKTFLMDNLEQWQKKERIPFQQAIASGVVSIMTGHIGTPKICSSLPASLSSCMVDIHLRKGLNFKGIVVTDSFRMKAISSVYTQEEATFKALMAGHDFVMVEYEHTDRILKGVCKLWTPNLQSKIEKRDQRVLESLNFFDKK